MPIAKVQLPDGRIARFEVAAGTTPAQVEEYVRANPAQFAPVSEHDKALSTQDQGTPLSWGDVAEQGAANILPSAGRMVEDLAEAAMHPVETLQNIGEVAVGLTGKIPGIENTGPEWERYNQKADAMIGFFKDRYGGIENLKQTMATDPVGFLADVSTILLPAGGALKATGTAAKAAGLAKAGEIAAEVGSAVSKAGAAVEPFNIGKAAVGKAVSLATPATLPERLYTSAAKFSTAIPVNDRIKFARRAIDEAILPNAKGVAKLGEGIDALKTQIGGLVDEATNQGKTIAVGDLAKGFDELRRKAEFSGKPETYVNQVNEIERQFLATHAGAGRMTFTPSEAQAFKQQIYRDLDNAYSSVSVDPYTVQAQKLLARNAKLELENLIPEIKQLNAREGALIELQDAIERSANRISNRDVIGLGLPVKVAGGAASGGAAGAASGMALGLIDTPAIKAKLAIALDSLKKRGVNLSAKSASIRDALLLPEREENE